jgi:hypothetical protein
MFSYAGINNYDKISSVEDTGRNILTFLKSVEFKTVKLNESIDEVMQS